MQGVLAMSPTGSFDRVTIGEGKLRGSWEDMACIISLFLTHTNRVCSHSLSHPLTLTLSLSDISGQAGLHLAVPMVLKWVKALPNALIVIKNRALHKVSRHYIHPHLLHTPSHPSMTERSDLLPLALSPLPANTRSHADTIFFKLNAT